MCIVTGKHLLRGTMAENFIPYQPGAILHDAVMGAFRAGGNTLEQWCRDHQVAASVARNATYGQMRGKRGQQMLAELIEAAGPGVVKVGYETRLRKHVLDLGLVAA
jgi:hypothetical protein